MSKRWPLWRRAQPLLAAAGLALATLPFAAAGHAAVTESQVIEQIEGAFAVKVLRVTAGDIGGRPVWLVTVMNEGGNSNAAFQVTTLAVDQESGDLVPSFRHKESGYSLPPGSNPLTDETVDPSRARQGHSWR